MKPTDILFTAKRTIQQEARAIEKLTEYANEDFVKAIEIIISCKGRVIISGIGKSAIIAQKIVATLNSTGTPSSFMHAADALHGDIGMIQQKDVVLVISKSGDSPEIKILVPLLKNFGNVLIAMVGQVKSFLALQADIILNTTVHEEACPNNLAPTSSTTAQMVMGDALAICLMEAKGFGSDEFAKFHPGGTIGKKLYLRVADLYIHNQKPAVKQDSSLKEVILEMTKKRLGATAVTDDDDIILGIITDGDLRRMLEKSIPVEEVKAHNIMTRLPKQIKGNNLAVDALDIMRKNNISQLLVNENNKYAGIIHIHDLLREGII